MEMPPDAGAEPGVPLPKPVPRWTGPFDDERAYRIDEPRRFLRGGLGVVFEAVISSDRHGAGLVGARVGLKQLTGIDDDRWVKLNERSSRLARVQHPNLSRHLGVFEGPRPERDGKEPDREDPQRYIVHLWVDGRPMADAVGHADVDTVLRWLRQIGDALDHLHTQAAGPFAHRDLHPRNVIINGDGDAVVIDYDTVFVGDEWTRTDARLGSRFAAPDDVTIPPQAGDRMALAKVAMHALAGDGDGVLDDKEVQEEAARRLRAHGARPNPALKLLEGALAGEGPDTCSELVSQLDTAIRARPRVGARWVEAAGGLRWPLRAVIAGALVAALASWFFVVRDRGEARVTLRPGPDTTMDKATTTTTTAPSLVTTIPTGATSPGQAPDGVRRGGRGADRGAAQNPAAPPVNASPRSGSPPPASCPAPTAAVPPAGDVILSFEASVSEDWRGINRYVERVACPAPHGAHVGRVTYDRFVASDPQYPNHYTFGTPEIDATDGCYEASVYLAAASPAAKDKEVQLLLRFWDSAGKSEQWPQSERVTLGDAFQRVTVKHRSTDVRRLADVSRVDTYVAQGGATEDDAFYADALSLRLTDSC